MLEVQSAEYDRQSSRLMPTIKAQALIDFIAECNIPKEEALMKVDQPAAIREAPKKPGVPPTVMQPGKVHQLIEELWTLYVDGSSSASGGGAGVLNIDRLFEALTRRHAVQVLTEPNNNWVKYARAKYKFPSWLHPMRKSNTSAYWQRESNSMG